MGVLSGQLLNTRVVSLVIQWQMWFFRSVLLNNLWLVILRPFDTASDDTANDYTSMNNANEIMKLMYSE